MLGGQIEGRWEGYVTRECDRGKLRRREGGKKEKGKVAEGIASPTPHENDARSPDMVWVRGLLGAYH